MKNINKNIRFGNKIIGDQKPCYIIAEIGSNHNQNKNLALEMIDLAAKSGANAVKFQSIKFESLYNEKYETKKFKKWFKQIELNEEWYPDLFKQAKLSKVDLLSSPTYEYAIDILESNKVKAYKIASPQFQADHEIVTKAARTNKPLFLSTGYALIKDILEVKKLCMKNLNNKLVFLHCVSKYPTSYKEANLNFINTLKKITGNLVGFSDHSLGYHMAIAAVTMGVCVLEKHVSINRKNKGPDHYFSMHFDEFEEMVKKIREIEQAFGSGKKTNY